MVGILSTKRKCVKWGFRFHLSRYFLHSVSHEHHLWRKKDLCYFLTPHQSFMEATQNFYESMKACGALKSKTIAQKLHARLITSGFSSSIFLQNHLLNMYSNCGLINDALRVFGYIENPNVFSFNTMINGLADSGQMNEAQKLFDEIQQRDTVSWNSMMSGYFHNGRPDSTIRVFVSMVRDKGCYPDPFSFSCVMKACGSLRLSKLASQVHCLVNKFHLGGDRYIESSIVDMYIKCGEVDSAEQVFCRISHPSLFCWNCMIYGRSKLYGVKGALELFHQMPERDNVSWNSIISILSQHGSGDQTLRMFIEMCTRGFTPNSMTYASVLSACASIGDLQWGTHLHGSVVRTEPGLDFYVGSGLIDMYAKCGRIMTARRVFDSLSEHNAVSWTSLIGGLALCGLESEALALFNQMRAVPLAPDQFTLATVLGACFTRKDLSLGEQLHGTTVKSGLVSSIPVGNALVTMYAKCGNIEHASHAFNLMPVRDIISWTAMISAFSQTGDIVQAREYFNRMPERNVITWNSLLATYMQHQFWEEGFKLFVVMLREGIESDWITFTTMISACAESAAFKLGNQSIAIAEKNGLASDVSVANSVVTLYSRCGHIKEARNIFDLMPTKDLVSWNTMMTGYAMNGEGRKVIEIFNCMIALGFRPDHISYVSVLSGCSHSGLVQEGQHYFNSMAKDHGISPSSEHYTCMVDLLGRAGLLEEAMDLISRMSFKPNASIWGALLGTCRIHGNTELAEVAVKNLLELNGEDSGSYVLLANIYSGSGELGGVAGVRKMMREKGIQKNPGCSWIEVDNRVHAFTADDTNHPLSSNIYEKLNEIIYMIEDTELFVQFN